MKKFHLESNDVCKIFPLTFLIENLEKINCEDNIFQGFREHEKLIVNEEHFNCNCQFESPYWLPEILLHNLSFPFLEIFSAYIVFMNKESDNNSNNQSFFHSINCLLTLTSQVLSLPDFKEKDKIHGLWRINKSGIEMIEFENEWEERQKDICLRKIDKIINYED